jgi:hypothetical protein
LRSDSDVKPVVNIESAFLAFASKKFRLRYTDECGNIVFKSFSTYDERAAFKQSSVFLRGKSWRKVKGLVSLVKVLLKNQNYLCRIDVVDYTLTFVRQSRAASVCGANKHCDTLSLPLASFPKRGRKDVGLLPR